MRITRIDVRFFRSFNYDFELKSRADSKPADWEDANPWFPFVKVPLEPDITAVVGANEAGKSQLLTAIEAVLTGAPIARADFCRYSELYSVKSGEIRLPEFGGTFHLEEGESLGLSRFEHVTDFTLYRPGANAPFLVIGDERFDLSAPELTTLESSLPTLHTLKTDLAIPDSVSIAELAGRARTPLQDRGKRTGFLQKLLGLAEPTEAEAGKLAVSVLRAGADEASELAEKKRAEEFALARTLLIDVAKVDAATFAELEDAIASEREGQVAAIVGGINATIRENLNIQRWWTQDRDFDLLVEAREQELAFAIRDRTASKYSFKERSQGLRFFLSYFVQLTAHRLQNTVPDVLLLDEPDAYLSSVGQQDLLRVLHEYAQPEGGGPRSQVVYVTHSPFLIDKNAPHRIRVLDKGSEDEGTRVVKDAANNRYEPLRSSLGAYVAETAFIGGRNLFVEGPADQILVAGLAAHLAKRNGTTYGGLDLNDVTVVGAGGADSIPYMVYLARGRDTVKPACVALLDGDKAGKEAERVLKRGDARKKRILKDEYILRLDVWASGHDLDLADGLRVEEIEDLIPLEIARRAALNHLARFVDIDEIDPTRFTSELIAAELAGNDGKLWESLTAAFVKAFPDEHLEKAGLAREVIGLLSLKAEVEGADLLRRRFSVLLTRLAEMLDDALSEEERARTDDHLKRAVRNFERDHTDGIKKIAARKLLRELETALDDADHVDEFRTRLYSISREFQLDDLAEPNTPRFAEFREQIRAFSNVSRIAYQDDASRDPASALIDAAATDAGSLRSADQIEAPEMPGDVPPKGKQKIGKQGADPVEG
ncbi:AAA family ATPase [Curtobacterium sp. MCBA15_013]|uniref:AAA family ATPase n=1 Tax=Curtobacterium sp. MCBA15_013 TaxID=1898739 RepID=UPI0009166CA7|nr:AAA family ATPase [Curtobacterium sp. MCBA15_013]OII21862.1 hypothetical protein BIV01_17725 [Curtobacterium sp. MCBA15_013]